MNTLKLLVVDDEPAMRTLLKQGLENAGHTVFEADGAEAALKTIDAQPIDLVLTDLRMEGQTGIDLLKAVLQKHPTMGVMLITGHATLDTAMEAMRLGAIDVLQKPLNLAELNQKVLSFSEKRKNRAALAAPGAGAESAQENNVDVHPVELSAIEGSETRDQPWNLDKVLDIQVTAAVQLGRTSIPIGELLKLGAGSILELDRRAGEPVELLVNDKPVAIGEVVVINDSFGLRVTNILDPRQRIQSLR